MTGYHRSAAAHLQLVSQVEQQLTLLGCGDTGRCIQQAKESSYTSVKPFDRTIRDVVSLHAMGQCTSRLREDREHT